MAGQSKLGDLAKGGVFGVYLSVQLAGLLLASASQRQETRYLNSTAVTLSEAIKVAVSMIGIAATERVLLGGLLRAVHQTLLKEPSQLLAVAVPALLYTIQNNVIYASLAHLDAVTFQITYQLKLVASLLATRLLLKKPVAYTKWLAVVLLTLGVVSVQLSLREDDEGPAGADNTEGGDASAGANNTEGGDASAGDNTEGGCASAGVAAAEGAARSRSRLIGIVGVLVACGCSGLAGAGMELLLKNSSQSLPRRNLQVRWQGRLRCRRSCAKG
jgi:UDP-sugar transporter A1/2/3